MHFITDIFENIDRQTEVPVLTRPRDPHDPNGPWVNRSALGRVVTRAPWYFAVCTVKPADRL